MITVRVPIDLHAVACTSCGAFASATPLRLRHLLSLAIREAIGPRAPQDKFLRTLRATLANFAAGRFIVDVNGRAYEHPDEVVVCAQTANVRFFLAHQRFEYRRQPALAREH